ncbi:MAG: acyltransferase [Bacilli bacterium]|nr:acyltransferase [Bacilli bacterium]
MKNNNIVKLKAIAILIVVLGHSIIIYDPNWGFYSSNYNIPFFIHLKHLINLIQMPLYFGISGYLFFYSKKNGFFQFFKNKFFRLIIPFLFVGLCYLLPIRLFVGFQNYINHSILYNYFVNIILGNDNGHLWFLPTLLIIFIISFFIKRFSNKFNNKFFDIIIFIILFITSFFGSRNSTYFNLALTFIIYFISGFYYNKYHDRISRYKYIIYFISLILICIYMFYDYEYYILTLTKILVTISFLSFDFGKLFNSNIIKYISNNSYGLYLFHSPLIYISFRFFPNINPIFMLVINFIIYPIICFLILKIIRILKLKFLIGE